MCDLIDPADHQDGLGSQGMIAIGLITRREIRRYARAVEDDNPLFWDVEYTREQGYADLVVPPNMPPSLLEAGAGTPAEDLQDDGPPPSLGVEPEFPPAVRTIKGERRLTFVSKYAICRYYTDCCNCLVPSQTSLESASGRSR
jgi:hypothetical protein